MDDGRGVTPPIDVLSLESMGNRSIIDVRVDEIHSECAHFNVNYDE